MEYESLTTLIEPYVDGPFDNLPDGLRELVIAAFDHQSEVFDSRQWVALTPDQRRAIAKDCDLAVSQRIERQAAYDESGLNGESIDWRYWAHQITTWSAAEAARLMSALDPDKFIALNERPGIDDPSPHCLKAVKIQRKAEREGMLNATPSAWLEWADVNGIYVHAGLRVQLLPQQNTATPAPTACVGAARRSNRKPAWATVAMPYMKSVFTTGNFRSAAVFYKALIIRASEPDSPFKLVNRELYCTKAGTTVSDGALGNVWAEIRAH